MPFLEGEEPQKNPTGRGGVPTFVQRNHRIFNVFKGKGNIKSLPFWVVFQTMELNIKREILLHYPKFFC